MLGDTTPDINPTPNIKTTWWASRWFSASRRWVCWPYSQPRTGVANRLPGIVSDRIPLARMRFVIKPSCKIGIQLSNSLWGRLQRPPNDSDDARRFA